MGKIGRFIKTIKTFFLKDKSVPGQKTGTSPKNKKGQKQQQKKNLAVMDNKKELFLIYGAKTAKNKFLKLSSSSNGLVFNERNLGASLNKRTSLTEDTLKWKNVRVSSGKDQYYLTYTKTGSQKTRLHILSSPDLVQWERKGSTEQIKEAGTIVPDYQYDNENIMYFGEKNIKMASSKNFKNWTPQKNILLKPRSDNFDSRATTPGNAFQYSEGIILFYYGYNKKKELSLGVALFHKDDPEKLIWRSESPLWQQEQGSKSTIRPLGIIKLAGDFLFYAEDEKGEVFSAFLPQICFEKGEIEEEQEEEHPLLERIADNPILKPVSDNEWESIAAFNPTSFECDEGNIYIIYRAIGDDDVSLFGCAVSEDGVKIKKKFSQPVYLPRESFEGAGKRQTKGSKVFSRYMSAGGGQGGCEDPKTTRIGNKVYLTYVAYDGENPPRAALSSIELEHIKKGDWEKWTRPVLISPPNIIDKSAILLPEKVNGKYVIFHRIFPNILVDFVDDLSSFDGETFFLQGEHKISPSPLSWDSKKISVASAPIKTKYGWLAIYHAVGYQEPLRYKIGAMLLDLDDPTKVLKRSRKPILEPETEYENSGHKYGVLYPGGANIKNGTLFVYYGGSDKYTCVATAPFEQFLNQLMTSEEPKIKKVTK